MTYRKSPAGYIFAGIAVVLLGVIVLLVYEALSLLTGAFPPITWEVSRAYGTHTYLLLGIGWPIVYCLGLLTGHFFWGQDIPPWFRLPGRS
jgi:hypothetical protein